MIKRIPFRYAILGLLLLILVSLVMAVAASNTVPDPTSAVKAWRSTPMPETTRMRGPEPDNHRHLSSQWDLYRTSKSELILGTSNADTITGNGGQTAFSAEAGTMTSPVVPEATSVSADPVPILFIPARPASNKYVLC